MAEFTEFPPGVPSWVDVSSPDMDASKAFYQALFGWDARDGGPDFGHYHQFFLRGKVVAGMGPTQEGQPPAWSTYLNVEDADAVMAAVKEAGGSVMFDPMDVADMGRMGFFVDPTGAFTGIWQPGTHKGAQLATETGTFIWNELNTRDTEAAKAFYGAVFGWESETHQMGPTSYTEFRIGGKPVGGMSDMAAMNVPPQVPAHWLVYFGVDDTDAAVATVQANGGSLRVGPMDIHPGRFAIVADPAGAHFAILRPTPM
ncbi:MAG: VOC family protein [Actinomycetota bacterium]